MPGVMGRRRGELRPVVIRASGPFSRLCARLSYLSASRSGGESMGDSGNMPAQKATVTAPKGVVEALPLRRSLVLTRVACANGATRAHVVRDFSPFVSHKLSPAEWRRLALEDIEALLAVYSIPRISQIQLIYKARLARPEFAPGDESLEVQLFSWNEIPWPDIAFPSVHWALHHHRDRGFKALEIHL